MLKFVEVQNEGQKIIGSLHLPENAPKPMPAVVFCHGFAGNRIGKYRLYVLIARRLAELGIASLRIDFRGSGESEGNFSAMTLEGEVSDVLQSIEFLKKQPEIDPERVGILGNSLGGAVAVLAAQKAGNIKSLVLLAALFDTKSWYDKWKKYSGKNDDESLKMLSYLLEGHVPGEQFFKSFFELNLEDALHSLSHVPLLHIHSIKDSRVDFSQAENYERCRKDATGANRWIRLKQCDHDFSNMDERSMIIEESAQWFSDTLGGKK